MPRRICYTSIIGIFMNLSVTFQHFTIRVDFEVVQDLPTTSNYDQDQSQQGYGDINQVMDTMTYDLSREGVNTVPKGHCAACNKLIVGQVGCAVSLFLTLSHIILNYFKLSHIISHYLTLSHIILKYLTLSHLISHYLT